MTSSVSVPLRGLDFITKIFLFPSGKQFKVSVPLRGLDFITILSFLVSNAGRQVSVPLRGLDFITPEEMTVLLDDHNDSFRPLTGIRFHNLSSLP